MSAFWCVALFHSWIVMNFEIKPVQILSRDGKVGNNCFFPIIQLWQNKITSVDTAADTCSSPINQGMGGSFHSVTCAMPFGVVLFLFETWYESIFTVRSLKLSFVLLVMPVSHSIPLNTLVCGPQTF